MKLESKKKARDGLGYCAGHKKQINKFGRIVKKELRVWSRN